MIPSIRTLLEFRDFWADKQGWIEPPSDEAIGFCHGYALVRATPEPSVEVAALFFAFSYHEYRLGRDAARKLPIRVARLHMKSCRLSLSRHYMSLLPSLQDDVAQEEKDWDVVRDWFENHLTEEI